MGRITRISLISVSWTLVFGSCAAHYLWNRIPLTVDVFYRRAASVPRSRAYARVGITAFRRETALPNALHQTRWQTLAINVEGINGRSASLRVNLYDNTGTICRPGAACLNIQSVDLGSLQRTFREIGIDTDDEQFHDEASLVWQEAVDVAHHRDTGKWREAFAAATGPALDVYTMHVNRAWMQAIIVALAVWLVVLALIVIAVCRCI